MTRRRIGIVGGGAAGLVTAWLLQEDHDVTVLEAAPHLGGHAHTRYVERDGHVVPIETGFRFFFESSYPRLMALMHLLDLEVFAQDNQISIRRPASTQTLVLPPSRLSEWLSVLASPRTTLDLARLRRFMSGGDQVVENRDWSHTLREYVEAAGYPAGFGERLLYPLVSASWGAPLAIMPEFPAYSVLKVMRLTGSKAVHLGFRRGINAYIEALVAGLGQTRLRTSVPVFRVGRDGDRRVVECRDGSRHTFDTLVLATPAWVTHQLLDPTDPALAEWREATGRFDWFRADICLHSDTRHMPADRRHWAELNHTHEAHRAWMTEWPGRRVGAEVFRTWLPEGMEPPRALHHRVAFRHLVLTKASRDHQRSLAALQGQHGFHVAGMYVTDVDNHESSVNSAADVARALAPESTRLAAWDVATAVGAVPRRTAYRPPQKPTGRDDRVAA